MFRGGRRAFRSACGAGVSLVAIALFVGGVDRATADTVNYALGQAYQNNPQLNAQRAAARATDENVAIALSGYRPRLTGTSSLSEAYIENQTRITTAPGSVRTSGENAVTTFGATATQTLFNGFQTGNRTRQAEAQVFAGRETL